MKFNDQWTGKKTCEHLIYCYCTDCTTAEYRTSLWLVQGMRSISTENYTDHINIYKGSINGKFKIKRSSGQIHKWVP